MPHESPPSSATDPATAQQVTGQASTDGTGQSRSARPIIRLKNLYKSFGRLRVLRGISLDFPRGQTTVVLGPSGCGKSVMLKHIIGLLRPDSGEVWFENHRIDTLTEARLVPIRQKFGFLVQQGALFDSMSVRENIAFPLLEHTSLNPQQRQERVRQVLSMVGLADVVDKMPADLSGGQRKRVALARAIVLEPTVILYDEPTTGLDPIRSDVINELIIKLQHELKITSIVVTHDLASAFKVADVTVMLHEGKVVFQGTPEALRDSSDPIVQQFLRGEASEAELAGINAMNGSSAARQLAPRINPKHERKTP
jgi:phospholipid/cholesterol/gamma-HCH transport system ATP-binding protein